ncbi:MAG: hypothetical protein PUI42_04955 [Lachnospiraceae bacterium]|nr:hypothetical protein [Lachnospiraceae bacterium]MDY3729653.1 hypothetical protein [Candidatus Choladocola sp.]
MRIGIISTQNGLLSGALMKYLEERGEIMPQRILSSDPDEPFKTCLSLNADILLMEVTRVPLYTLAERMTTISEVRRKIPKCKIALLCDENADQELAEQVKDAKKNGLIDGFFYSSVSGEYLAAALDSM